MVNSKQQFINALDDFICFRNNQCFISRVDWRVVDVAGDPLMTTESLQLGALLFSLPFGLDKFILTVSISNHIVEFYSNNWY